uniref:Uncharacterized protein n=1 Tax=Polytomella parva TaxID=51329 RepID=A0A7S0V831_9CHLO
MERKKGAKRKKENTLGGKKRPRKKDPNLDVVKIQIGQPLSAEEKRRRERQGEILDGLRQQVRITAAAAFVPLATEDMRVKRGAERKRGRGGKENKKGEGKEKEGQSDIQSIKKRIVATGVVKNLIAMAKRTTKLAGAAAEKESSIRVLRILAQDDGVVAKACQRAGIPI